MKKTYYDIISCTDRIYRLFLEAIRHDLDNLGILDINSVQALIIYNVAEQKISVGELISRGLYNGSNVSYNLKKLTQMGYLEQRQSEHDKRSLFIYLTEKGLKTYKDIDNCLEDHTKKLDMIFQNSKNLESIYKGLQGIETFLGHSNFWL
jgi:DNA-binding MarR family transcriptional regulator